MELKLNNRMVEIPPFLQEYVEQGISQGISQGELKHSRTMLERMVHRAGIVLTDELKMRIEACTDVVVLDKWIENAIDATTAADVFGEG